jgi:hypothetical protein
VGDYCAECDFTYDLEQASRAGDRVVELAGEINVILGRGDIDLRRRPRPDVWSPLEYGCHTQPSRPRLRGAGLCQCLKDQVYVFGGVVKVKRQPGQARPCADRYTGLG